MDVIVIDLSKGPQAQDAQRGFLGKNFEILTILVFVCYVLDVIFLLQPTQTEQFVKLLEAAIISETLSISLMFLQRDEGLHSEEARSVDQNRGWQDGYHQKLDKIVGEDDLALAVCWSYIGVMVQPKVDQILLIELIVSEIELTECNHARVDKYQYGDSEEVGDLNEAYDMDPMSHKRILFNLVLTTVIICVVLNDLLLLNVQLDVLFISNRLASSPVSVYCTSDPTPGTFQY